MRLFENVRVWEETVVIPTYRIGAPDKNPMFLEKRVYQGSSGRVYPHSVIDKIYDEKEDKPYRAVFLENEFIRVMVLPELGGRIQRATDKASGYDFVYYNHVIKPALVGLAGPWISGGIEFNWPQHHRPSTFDPVEYRFFENEDGSATVVVGEIEAMFRTKGMARFTLYPDSAYIEIKAQLFNRTDVPQTFLWWANPAVAVNENTRSIFPPDVTAVMDHGKRAVSTFPIATGTYYKVDYSAGVDISRYKNLPVPTSYMAAKSDYDFVGGYDDGVQAGILHVADHHVSPGKKQWTWGCGDFGQAWDRNLTDEDGPYVELMTGCFTDNQPDFSWLAPMEEKRFTQYFMPYRQIGTIHNATKDLAMNFENGSVHLYAAGNVGEITVEAWSDAACVERHACTLLPTESMELQVKAAQSITQLRILRQGRLYLSYTVNGRKQTVPPAATCPPDPKNCATNEDLYLYGLHIEQYRHATYAAEDYYLEGLRRDPTDLRLNNAYGLLLLRRGLFEESERYFKAAVSKAVRSNPNPYDSEPYYNLGLSLQRQDRTAESQDAFYKSAWSNACQEAAFYHLACISASSGDWAAALEHLENALIKNARNYRAMNLKALVLRATGREEQAQALARQIQSLDPLDPLSGRLLGKKGAHNPNTMIEIALEYAAAGFCKEAICVLREDESGYPMIGYHLASLYSRLGDTGAQREALHAAQAASSFGCFPHRIEDLQVLEQAVSHNPEDAMAHYYLGCLLYDKKRDEEAIIHYEACTRICPAFPTAHRNLSLACYNKLHDAARALHEMEAAFSLDETDARVLMELDQLCKKIGTSPQKRLAFLERYPDLICTRDDLFTEFLTLLNLAGRHHEALDRILSHSFHPWEGGEGKAPAQYVFSLTAMAKEAIGCGEPEKALSLLAKTASYPHNLGEGKLFGAQENLQDYLRGCAYEQLGEPEKAAEAFRNASSGLSEPQSAMYYNDQPPETIFCQGMALRRLGRADEARNRFETLISYAQAHGEDDVKIDYFAVSLPDFLVFDEDLKLKNQVHCLFMKALGLLGMGDAAQTREALSAAEALDCNHFGISSYRRLFL